MGRIVTYTGMLLRAYTRDYPALFFSLFFPLLFMLLFGFLNLGGFGHVNVGIVDQARTPESALFVETLRKVETLRISGGSLAEERTSLERSNRDLVIVIPADFRLARVQPGSPAPTLTVLTNVARPQQVGVGRAILTQLVNQTTFAVTETVPVVTVKTEVVNSQKLGYVDFLTPGILGMTIMQGGIAGVAFSLVADRQRGVLRRMFATPLTPRMFLATQVIFRLVITVLQVLVLLGVALFVFQVNLVGGLGTVMLLAILGAILFLCMGFALSGVCSTENQVAPLVQILTLPQLFLSGVFFGRDAMPALLQPVSALLPLTFLNDALRQVSTTGASLWDVRAEMLGLGVWIVISFALAGRFFKLDR